MKLELALRYQPQPQRAATAWYFPVSDATQWLQVIARVGWDQTLLRCVPIPNSRGDLTARGVLFLPMLGSKSAKRYTASDFLLAAIDPRLQPYGELHARVYLPVGATLNAALAPEEFAELAPTADSLLIWLPDLGLLALAQSELLCVADLLQAPAIIESAWDAAEPGPALNTRLLSLQPTDPPTLDDFRQAAQDGIGSQAAQTGDLPPSPREASPGLAAGAGRALTNGVAGAIGAAGGLFDKLKGMFSSAPSPTSNTAAANAAAAKQAGPSMFQRLRDWATQQQQRISDSVSAARDRELTRLLEMLQNNPDEGLRYAIPLAGDAARGIAPPGSQLMARDTNFRFGGGGSGPSDYWAIAEQNRQALIARYRDLASREIALGRHRRAAYIFAELLGDFGAAAQTLADGKHYREAALLYEERLRNPRAAAKCLEQGGLLTEAIAIYQRLNEHETVGDLYARLEQKDLAAEAYDRAYELLIQAGNFLRAAELSEQKLLDVERALTTLDRGWLLSTNQRQSCFLRSFTVLARETQHERARKYLEQTIRRMVEARDVTTFVPDLVTVATTYPDAPLRDFGKDQSRLLIGRHLSQATSSGGWEQQSLLQALNKLEPNDRLLARDTRRFEAKIGRPAWPVDMTPKRAPPKRGQVLQVEQTQLPCDHCQAMVSHGNHYYIAGMRGEMRVFLRADEQGRVHYPTGKVQRVMGGKDKSDIQLVWNSAGREKILVMPYRGDIADRTFPATDRFPEEVTIGSGPMIGERTIAVSFNGSRAISSLTAINDGPLTLNHYADSSGRVLKSHQVLLEYDIPEDEEDSFYNSQHYLHSHFEHWFIGYHRQLWIGQGSAKEPSVVSLPGTLRGFVAAPANSLFRLVSLLDEGIHFTWGYLTNLQHTRAAEGVAYPVACFTDKGHLIVVGNNGIEIYNTTQDGLRMIAELKSIALKPIGVLSIPGTQKFIVVQSDGLAITYSWT